MLELCQVPKYCAIESRIEWLTQGSEKGQGKIHQENQNPSLTKTLGKGGCGLSIVGWGSAHASTHL